MRLLLNEYFILGKKTPAVCEDYRLCRLETILPKVYDPIVKGNNALRSETDPFIKPFAFCVFNQ